MTEDRSRLARRRVRRGRSGTQEPPPAPAATPPPETRAEPGAGTPATAAGPQIPTAEVRPVPQPPRPASRPRRDGDRGERGLRGLVGPGPSQVGVSGALRARDAARPTAADLRAAEENLVVVRRHYVPPDRLSSADPRTAHLPKPGAHPDGSVPDHS